MDGDHDGFLNFKEFVQTFDILCKGDHTSKLKLIYCLHLPGVVLPGELVSPTANEDGAEIACDATDFFKNDDEKNLGEKRKEKKKTTRRDQTTPDGLGQNFFIGRRNECRFNTFVLNFRRLRHRG